ncbi:MAG: shikimate kinase [Bacteroidales bacterium]|nr:shikimate kinase [Bacteroidales bacterium]
MNIYLVGYMCCGKTTIGKKLAKRLGYNFIDLDQLFEKENNTSISNFFEEHGEAAFRVLETNILHSTALLPGNNVIATGGGTPCTANNMEWINENGISIYLSVNKGFIANRIVNSKQTTRPLLKNIPIDQIATYVDEQLKIREQYYLKAQIINTTQNIDDIIEQL